MAIFLKVLSVIGLVLLAILALIILILLLVLFVPVRYRVKGSFKDNSPSLCAKVTWLLHIVSVKYLLGEEEPLVIKIFGFKLKKEKEEIPDFNEEDEFEATSVITEPKPEISQESTSEASHEPEPEPVAEPLSLTEPEPEVVAPEEKPEPEEISEPEASESDGKDAKDKKEKKPQKAKKDKADNKDFENQHFYDRIKKYIEIIESKRFKKAFEYSKKKIFKLLKHIKPRRINIWGEVGFDDPSLTGTVIAVTSMLIPVFGNSVRIKGNFEEPVLSIEGDIKGHITLLRVLWTLAVLYFNRDLRKIIKMFREV